MTRLYARSTGGARIHETTPDGRWKILAILGAISTRGMIATMTIEAAGASLLYLPPYSPDLNPIENAWAKLKQLLRAAKARTKEALDQAITELLPLLTPENA